MVCIWSYTTCCISVYKVWSSCMVFIWHYNMLYFSLQRVVKMYSAHLKAIQHVIFQFTRCDQDVWSWSESHTACYISVYKVWSRCMVLIWKPYNMFYFYFSLQGVIKMYGAYLKPIQHVIFQFTRCDQDVWCSSESHTTCYISVYKVWSKMCGDHLKASAAMLRLRLFDVVFQFTGCNQDIWCLSKGQSSYG